MGRNATSKIGVNAVTGRGYNPSVAPKARQLPLHSWLSSAAGGGYSEKGKPLPSASARANSRSTSGERRGSRESFCKHSVQTLHGGAEKRHQLLLCMSTITTFAHTRCISPSVFLHLLGAKIHLPPQREARRLRRTPQNQCCGTFLSRCVRTAHTHLLFAQRAKNTTCPKGRYNRAGRRDITRGKAADITETRRKAPYFTAAQPHGAHTLIIHYSLLLIH